MLAVPRSKVLSALRSFFCASAVIGVAVLSACSSTTDVGPPACDDAKCAPGNQCLTLDGEKKCRKVCGSNSEASESCPFGYTCTDTLSGEPPFCVKDKAVRDDGAPLEKKASGQWGAACQANLGMANPGCDGDQTFYCYATSPTDGDAYCTRYDCEADDECGAGFHCATVNEKPNANTAKRGAVGATQRVCLRREYCAPCKADVDCPTLGGVKQHCIEDASGSSFCAPECTKTSNCPYEAVCADAGLESKICYPRATVCAGDGSLCSPCQSDADCGDDGVCVKGQYTTEKACAKKAPGGDCSACPESTSSPAKIGCTREDSDLAPKNYCVGLYEFGRPMQGQQGMDVGCWTPKR